MKTWVWGISKYVIGFGILAVVIHKYWEPNAESGSPGLRNLLEGPIAWKWLLTCLLIIVLAWSLQIIRWYLLICALRIPLKFARAFQLGLLGLFGNTFLPGALGGDFFRAYFLAKEKPGQRVAAVSTVLVDRAFGLFGLILLTAVVGSMAWANGDARIVANADLQWIIEVTFVIAGSSILGFLLLGFLPQHRVRYFADWLRTFSRIGVLFANFFYATTEFRNHMKVMGWGLVLTVASQFLMVVTFYVAAQVFPPKHPDTALATLPELMVIAPIGFAAQALPLAPGGVGVGEAAFAGLYRLANRPASRGVIARLAMRVAEWILALAAWLVYFHMWKDIREAKEQAKEEENGDSARSAPRK